MFARLLLCLEKMKRHFRRRSVIFIVLICILMFISGKIFIGTDTETNNSNVLTITRQFYGTSTNDVPLETRVARRLVYDVRCDEIMKGTQSEIAKAKGIMQMKNYTRKTISDNEYVEMTKDCDNFKRFRHYNMFTSQEESSLSVAYSILLYKDVDQAERLLRAIYSPSNYYCLHVDADSRISIHQAVQGIADCFKNVFVVSRKEYIVYSGFTRLQADLNCMENLLQYNSDWQYFINLPSQQFPLKTNSEIVKILKIYNGANDIEGLTGGRRLSSRFTHRYVYKPVNTSIKLKASRLNQEKEAPPYKVTVVKGSAYGIFSRDFVNFVINNNTARTILDWFRDVYSPDEYYWATLNYNHHLKPPGSFYHGKPDDKPWLAVFAAWGGVNPCAGKYVRGVCVFGVGDLHTLTKKEALFANKFYVDFQPLALDCMEEWHLNRTALGGWSDINTTFYESLPFIKRP